MNHNWQPIERGFRCANPGCGVWSLKGTSIGECNPSPPDNYVPPPAPPAPEPLESFDASAESHGPAVVEAWGIAKRAFSLARAARKWALAGFPLRTEDQRLQILATCQACPLARKSGDSIACSICGCTLAENAGRDHGLKIKWATTSCPENRWPA